MVAADDAEMDKEDQPNPTFRSTNNVSASAYAIEAPAVLIVPSTFLFITRDGVLNTDKIVQRNTGS